MRQKKILEQAYLINKKMMVAEVQSKKKECLKLISDKGKNLAYFEFKCEDLRNKEEELRGLLGLSINDHTTPMQKVIIEVSEDTIVS